MPPTPQQDKQIYPTLTRAKTHSLCVPKDTLNFSAVCPAVPEIRGGVRTSARADVQSEQLSQACKRAG